MKTVPIQSPPFPSRWRTLFLVHFCIVAFGVTLQMIPPILPRLISDTGLTHAQAGTLMGLFTLPGIFLALPGGRISDAIGPRRVGIVSLLFMGLGTLLMSPLLLPFLYLGRVCAGVGAGIFVVVAPQIITKSFPSHELGLAMGIFNTAVPIGSIAAFNGLGYLSGRFGMTIPIAATAALSLTAFLAFYFTYSDPDFAPDAGRENSNREESLGLGIWLVAGVWTLFNIGLLSYFTYSIDHLTSAGTSFPAARFLGSLPMILSIGFTPAAGLIIHRLGFRWSLATVGCAISAVAVWLLYFSSGGHPILWSIILGAGLSLVPPAVFTLAGEVVPAGRLGTGYGLLTTLFNLGIFIGIPFVGKVHDLTGGYRYSFGLMALFLLLGSLLAIVSGKILSENFRTRQLN